MALPSYFNIPWIISQYWSDLVFINYKIAPEQIQKRLPSGYEVDTFNGDAFLSIVPFKMSKVRFPFTPQIPFSQLWELNIRTYVKVKGIPGIYFFTLDTNHWPAMFVAKNFFALPYRYTKLKGESKETQFSFSSKNLDIDISLQSTIVKDEYKNWISERYSLFTQKNIHTLQGIAMHDPWQLKAITIKKLEQTFLQEFGFNDYEFKDAFAGNPIWVKFRPFQRV